MNTVNFYENEKNDLNIYQNDLLELGLRVDGVSTFPSMMSGDSQATAFRGDSQE